MKKSLILLTVLVLAVLTASVAVANGNPAVFGTFRTLTTDQFANGVFKASGGMPLFMDGTVGGQIQGNVLNGQQIGFVRGLFWEEVDLESIRICFEIEVIQNPGGLPVPPGFCKDFPVSGTPVGFDNDGDGDADIMEWVVLTN